MSNPVFIAIGRVLVLWLFLALIFLVLVLIGAAHGPWNYFWFFTMLCWAMRDIYWVAAAGPKSAIPISRLGAMTTFSIYALYCLPLSSVPWLGLRLLPYSLALNWLGASLSAFGIGFSVWARCVLARSWNPCWLAAVPLQDDHRLVQIGPYAIVRHPIYFGMLAAACGMVIVLGEARALVLLFGVELLLKRIAMEETVLRATFPGEYPAYERRVKRLLPGIW